MFAVTLMMHVEVMVALSIGFCQQPTGADVLCNLSARLQVVVQSK